jgi:hypothetical protein
MACLVLTETDVMDVSVGVKAWVYKTLVGFKLF